MVKKSHKILTYTYIEPPEQKKVVFSVPSVCVLAHACACVRGHDLCSCLPKQKCIVGKFRKAMVCALGTQTWNLYFVLNLFYGWDKFHCCLLFSDQPSSISKVTLSTWVIYQKCMYSVYWFFILFMTWQNERCFELQLIKKNEKF
jgi:hypothetical protein